MKSAMLSAREALVAALRAAADYVARHMSGPAPLVTNPLLLALVPEEARKRLLEHPADVMMERLRQGLARDDDAVKDLYRRAKREGRREMAEEVVLTLTWLTIPTAHPCKGGCRVQPMEPHVHVQQSVVDRIRALAAREGGGANTAERGSEYSSGGDVTVAGSQVSVSGAASLVAVDADAAPSAQPSGGVSGLQARDTTSGEDNRAGEPATLLRGKVSGDFSGNTTYDVAGLPKTPESSPGTGEPGVLKVLGEPAATLGGAASGSPTRDERTTICDDAGATPAGAPDLLPCPFCGADEATVSDDSDGTRIVCPACAASTDYCSRVLLSKAAEQAAEKWNRREGEMRAARAMRDAILGILCQRSEHWDDSALHTMAVLYEAVEAKTADLAAIVRRAREGT